MKKRILAGILVMTFVILFTACEKDEIGGTATEKMAGEWFVVADAVDSEGNVVFEDADLFGIGYFHLDTYNTSTNSLTEMWINDNGNFWDFKARININFETMTFAAANVENQAYDSKVTIEDGKIILG
ncbi:MAG: lipid-binding protein, partial [Fermentimonas sp.]|nr:lipid-binding protein [Fermentimonas sp.]